MTERTLAERLDAAWGDPGHWTASGLHWTHLSQIQDTIARRVSGTPSIKALDWFMRQVAEVEPLPLRRVLVLGCGSGAAERALVGNGDAQQAVAIDLSASVLEGARRQAAGDARIVYLQADMNALPVGHPHLEPGCFDAVVGISSVHHCEHLESLYACLHALLKPGGWLFLDEYVGPERFQYTPRHMAFVNQVAETLPDRLLRTRSGQLRKGFRAPTVQEVVEVDPSEAVNAQRILPALAPWFEVLAVRPYGGPLLQILLAEVAQNFKAEDEPWLSALVQAEDDALKAGILEHHFSCAIARARPAANVPPRTDR